jgi:hypothetical protein
MKDHLPPKRSKSRPVFSGESRRFFCRDVTGLDCGRVLKDDEENCGIESHVRIVPLGAAIGESTFRTRSSFHQRKLTVEEDYELLFDEGRESVDFDASTFNPKDLWVATKVQKEFTSYHKCNAEDAIYNLRLLIEKAIQEGKYKKLNSACHLFTWRGYIAIISSDLQVVVRYRTSHYERTPKQVADGVKSRLSSKRKAPRWAGPVPDTITPGLIVDGKVKNTMNYGVFVEIIDGFEALLHRSELFHLREGENEAIRIGESLRVEVTSVDRDLKRVTLRLVNQTKEG